MTTPLRTEFLFELSLEVQGLQDIGATPRGGRLIALIGGGTFRGPKLSGIVLPGGADSILVRPNGVRELNVRITLETDAKQLIYMSYQGIDTTKPEVAKRIAAGEDVHPEEYYWRVTPTFETGSDKERWLNDVLAVGIGRRAAAGPIYAVHVIR